MPRNITDPRQSSWAFFDFTGRKNAARTGAGIFDVGPFTDRQITSLNRMSSARSSTARLNFSDRAAPYAPGWFNAFRSASGTRWVYGSSVGFAVNEWYIGRAAASNWLIGFSPR